MKELTLKEKCLMGAIVGASVAFIFPPVKKVFNSTVLHQKWVFIGAIPEYYGIDLGILLVEFILIFAIASGVFMLTSKNSSDSGR